MGAGVSARKNSGQATAGVFAIAQTYGGMRGKVYGEILESDEPQPQYVAA